jgi:hypothetical protein
MPGGICNMPPGIFYAQGEDFEVWPVGHAVRITT